MFKIIAASALALSVVAENIKGFPAFDMMHANCVLDADYKQDCTTLYGEYMDKIAEYENGCPSNGIYKFIDAKEDTYIWATRTTPVKKYVDDVAFEFSATATGCHVHARSRSQTTSVYDYATNYCNMWNPMVHVTRDAGEAPFMNLQASKCKYQADPAEEVCLQY